MSNRQEVTEVVIIEPAILDLPVMGKLSLWYFQDDGGVVIRKGGDFAACDTLLIEAHEITSLRATLQAIAEMINGENVVPLKTG